MTTNEIRQIVESIVADKQVANCWYSFALLVVAGLSAFLGAYFSTKGKNLATKEDIGRITGETQKAMEPFNERLVIFTKEIERRNALEEKNADNAFVLSATSHMAQVAFDKHMEFCEKYVSKVYESLHVLLQEGPTIKTLDIANELFRVRLSFRLWETEDVAITLDKFEKALRSIATDTRWSELSRDAQKRGELIDSAFSTFGKVMTLDPLPDSPTPDIAVAHIIAGLRDHLGISQLTALRKHYLAEAEKRIKSH